MQAQDRWADLVNPLVGTAPSTVPSASKFGRNTEVLGQTLPAVLVPNGMNFWTPQTRPTEQKCVAPYYYNDGLWQGFRCSHWIVGGCTQDYGSFTIAVMMDSLRLTPVERAVPFSHEDELTTPYYYRLRLPQEHLTAEMTGTERSGIFRFTFHRAGTAYLLVESNSDREEGSVGCMPEQHCITATNPVHRIYQGKGLPAGFSGHFYAEWLASGPAATVVHAAQQRLVLACQVEAGDTLLVRAAASFCDQDGARRNLQSEIADWNFDRVSHQLRDLWNRHLGRVEVEADDTTQLRKFYTSLYHASFLPRLMNDVDGRYPSFGGSHTRPCRIVRVRTGHNHYGDYSLWDTYRALHPLLTILEPTKTADMMQSLVDMAREGHGWLPIFPCWNSYTAAMIGDHATATLCDAYLKGIEGFDIGRAYRAMRRNAFRTPRRQADYIEGKGRRALRSYRRYGYIPLEDSVPYAYHPREQVSRTLEYAFDDYCLSRLATLLGHRRDASRLTQRARNWRNVIDPRTGYAQGRQADGQFLSDDNAHTFTSFITEGAPCHYTFYVPHDPQGLVRHLGGPDVFRQHLDSLFTEQHYWHGNEPCHQIPYLYNTIGLYTQTSQTVRHILDTEYRDEPGGLSGNDDAGQMSAWYVFSSLGLYPLCPSTTQYELSSPLHPRATLHLENGHTLIIRRDTTLAAPQFNGQPLPTRQFRHHDLMQGGTLLLP